MTNGNFVFSLKQNLNQSVLNHNLISRNLLTHGKALSGAHVKLPAVPFTLDHMIAKSSLG